MLDDYEYQDTDSGSGWSTLGAMTVAAAVGAGVALLFSTDTGRRTRERVRQQIEDLDLRDHAELLGSAALEGISRIRGRRPRKNRGAVYAALGTAAGATIAASLAPESTRRAREWVEDALGEIRHNASTRWQEHKTRRHHRMTPDTAKAMRRLEEGAESAGSAAPVVEKEGAKQS